MQLLTELLIHLTKTTAKLARALNVRFLLSYVLLSNPEKLIIEKFHVKLLLRPTHIALLYKH